MPAKLLFKSNTSALTRYTFDTGILETVSGKQTEPHLIATVKADKELTFLTLTSEHGTGEVSLSLEEARGLAELITQELGGIPDAG